VSVARRAPGLIAALFLVATGVARAQEPPAAPTPPPASAPAPTSTAHVTYLTALSVYLDAGRQDGLWEGDELQIVRDGAVVATLKVTNLSPHKASCSIVSSSSPLVVGDVARFTPRPVASAPAGAGAASQTGTAGGGAAAGGSSSGATASAARLHGPGLHGRVGVNFLYMQSDQDVGYHQPGVTLRLDGRDLGGAPVDMDVDVRTRRTYRSLPGSQSETYNQNWVYQAAVSMRPGHGDDRFTLGRQFSADVAALNLFDGVLYDHQGDRWGAGAFSGVQPRADDLGFSTDIREWGGYYRVHGAAAETPHNWSATIGLVDSYQEGTVNREFFYLQGQYHGRALSAFMSEEVDYNRAWKVSEAGESTFSPTATFVSLNYRPNAKVALFGGYDDRRNVRLYTDRVTPLTEFDESRRQGTWAGGWFHIGSHFLVGADARRSDGGPNGTADSWSGRLGVDGLGVEAVSVEGRGTRFTNDRSEGWLYSFDYGMNLGRYTHFGVSLGRIDETYPDDSDLDRNLDWAGLDVDFLVGRTWFVVMSVEKNHGSQEANTQGFLGITWRF
jgi:hypothetical protein